jgi:hypothetical protein
MQICIYVLEKLKGSPSGAKQEEKYKNKYKTERNLNYFLIDISFIFF